MGKGEIAAIALMAALLSGCSMQEPPACSDPRVDELVRQLLDDDTATVLDAKVDARDPVSLLGLMSLGIGMNDDGAFMVTDQAATGLNWKLAHHRSVGLNPGAAIRSCSVDVIYGTRSEAVGSFTLDYTVAFTDDGNLSVQLIK